MAETQAGVEDRLPADLSLGLGPPNAQGTSREPILTNHCVLPAQYARSTTIDLEIYLAQLGLEKVFGAQHYS
ncbi:MAG: hypothetical protein E3J37_02055 [Anaerolineales bacterium]|nr:MAG: hypothetical protein E3J37_02055 [Anaerolineales bacterium]